MKSIAARFARAVNRVFRRSGRVLRDRYRLHVLETPREVRNALRYVLLNGRRHAGRRGEGCAGPCASTRPPRGRGSTAGGTA
jgi:hypothetical protein